MGEIFCPAKIFWLQLLGIIICNHVIQTLECNKSTVNEAKDTTKPPLSNIILLTKGPFVSPRMMIKNMTTRYRPPAEEILQEMKKLEEEGLGTVKSITKTQTVHYKPIPNDDNKEDVLTTIATEEWDAYIAHFKDVDLIYMTASQHNRFLLESDDEDVLNSFGITPRESN